LNVKYGSLTGSRYWAQEKPDPFRHPGDDAKGSDPVFFTLLLTVESILVISEPPHCSHFTDSTLEKDGTMASNSFLQVLHLNS